MWFRQYLCLLIIRSSVRVGNVKIRIWLETEEKQELLSLVNIQENRSIHSNMGHLA